MKINILPSHRHAHKARGLTVVIDVLRAFTTTCFHFANGAVKIIPVGEVEEARKLRKQNPHFVLAGERLGEKQPGFDFGNSPFELLNVDLQGKTVIFTTSTGTKGILRSTQAQEIITGSFVNAGAVTTYIQKRRPSEITLLCTDEREDPNLEDWQLALFLSGKLRGQQTDFDKIRKQLLLRSGLHPFIYDPQKAGLKKDLHLALELDRFDFVVKGARQNGNVVMEKEAV